MIFFMEHCDEGELELHMKNIIQAGVTDWYTLVITINWVAVLVIIAAIFLIQKLITKTGTFSSWHPKTLKAEIPGLGTIEFEESQKTRELAYQIWVELGTRKIGLEFDEEYDVIDEVYNSWYEAFKTIRNILEAIPANEMQHSEMFISLSVRVLNDGLRPHLTQWQAKFRKWYQEELKNSNGKSPQEIQRQFPEYGALVTSLKNTNAVMIGYCNSMRDYAFGEEK